MVSPNQAFLPSTTARIWLTFIPVSSWIASRDHQQPSRLTPTVRIAAAQGTRVSESWLQSRRLVCRSRLCDMSDSSVSQRNALAQFVSRAKLFLPIRILVLGMQNTGNLRSPFAAQNRPHILCVLPLDALSAFDCSSSPEMEDLAPPSFWMLGWYLPGFAASTY